MNLKVYPIIWADMCLGLHQGDMHRLNSAIVTSLLDMI